MIVTLGWLSLTGFLAMGFWIFGFLPAEQSMGFSQRIMYLHVPSVIIAEYVAFPVILFASVGYLWKRTGGFDRVAKSSAEVGLLFCGVGILTGAIWGRPTWGTYWVWDARLTTALLLFMIYVGYVLLRAFAAPGEQQARLAAVIGIVGALDIPLIHFSVQWWRTLHQPSTLFKVGSSGEPKPSLPPEFLYPLLTSILLMTVFYLFLLFYRMRIEAQEEELSHRLASQ